MLNIFDKDLKKVTVEDVNNKILNKLHEGLYTEFKSNFNEGKKNISKTVCSFANSEGGYMIVGVDGKKIYLLIPFVELIIKSLQKRLLMMS